LNLATAQEAARPNSALNGTAIAATRSVSLIAASASGSRKFAKNAATPWRKPSANTRASGRNSSAASSTVVTPISALRTAGVSLVTGCRRSPMAISDKTEPPAAMGLHLVDEEEQRERYREHDGRDHCRSGIVEFLELHHDEQRRDFRDH